MQFVDGNAVPLFRQPRCGCCPELLAAAPRRRLVAADEDESPRCQWSGLQSHGTDYGDFEHRRTRTWWAAQCAARFTLPPMGGARAIASARLPIWGEVPAANGGTTSSLQRRRSFYAARRRGLHLG